MEGELQPQGFPFLSNPPPLLSNPPLPSPPLPLPSWDGTVKLWSTSSPTSAAAGSLASISAGGKVFAMDWVGSTLMVATSGRKVLIFEVSVCNVATFNAAVATFNSAIVSNVDQQQPISLRLTSSVAFSQVKKAGDSFEVSQVQARDSSLKFQTRSCALFPDRTGFALGSIEGRVAIEYMEETDVAVAQGKKKYAFKCHRVGDVVYPVNAIAFHPVHGTFATGGCDGQVVLWDARHKKRLVALPRLETSVACLAFSKGGDAGRLLAVAQSYTFEEGEKDHPPDQIYVRELFEHEVKASGAK